MIVARSSIRLAKAGMDALVWKLMKTVHATNVGAECVIDMCMAKAEFVQWFHVKDGECTDFETEVPVNITDPNVRVQGLRFHNFLHTLAQLLVTYDDVGFA